MSRISRVFALLSFSCVLLLSACNAPAPPVDPELKEGDWFLEMDLGEQRLPVPFTLVREGDEPHVLVHNGEETIRVEDIERRGDSLFVRMPLFDSQFIATVLNDSMIQGYWYNYLKGPDYRIPFQAHAGERPRFTANNAPQGNITGTWECRFSPDGPKPYDAIGLFRHDGHRVTGTFGTETGDYRFLEGVMDGDSMKLSCFDGSHAFLFHAVLRSDSLLGRFWSGTHWEEAWYAVRNPDFELRDPDSLTTLREGYDMVTVSFPGVDGDTVSSSDPVYQGKVLVIQVMGSWCPNCVDETRLLNQLHARYNDEGLEVLAIAFEKYPEPERAMQALRQFRDQLDVPYAITYAGLASKEAASQQLPFLEHIMSFPTSIFIDRNGKVRRIRTGFYGPGTGEHYHNYVRNLERFIGEMLREEVVAR